MVRIAPGLRPGRVSHPSPSARQCRDGPEPKAGAVDDGRLVRDYERRRTTSDAMSKLGTMRLPATRRACRNVSSSDVNRGERKAE
jgi:hypothetical protein